MTLLSQDAGMWCHRCRHVVACTNDTGSWRCPQGHNPCDPPIAPHGGGDIYRSCVECGGNMLSRDARPVCAVCAAPGRYKR